MNFINSQASNNIEYSINTNENVSYKEEEEDSKINYDSFKGVFYLLKVEK